MLLQEWYCSALCEALGGDMRALEGKAKAGSGTLVLPKAAGGRATGTCVASSVRAAAVRLALQKLRSRVRSLLSVTSKAWPLAVKQQRHGILTLASSVPCRVCCIEDMGACCVCCVE